MVSGYAVTCKDYQKKSQWSKLRIAQAHHPPRVAVDPQARSTKNTHIAKINSVTYLWSYTNTAISNISPETPGECHCAEHQYHRIEQKVFHDVSQSFMSLSQCFTIGSWCFSIFTSVSWCLTMFYVYKVTQRSASEPWDCQSVNHHRDQR